jgi:alpha-1,6-mannosyltransferase
MKNKSQYVYIRWLTLLLYGLIGASFYAYLGYAGLARQDFGLWLSAWLLLWIWAAIGYWAVAWRAWWRWQYLAAIAIGWRLAWGDTLPLLSDDFWRFLWDGRLWAHGINPFLYRPEQIMADLPDWANDLQLSQIYSGSNSKNYYSVYPLFSQIWFVIAAKFGNFDIHQEVLILRLVLVLADVFTILGIYKLLKLKNLPTYYTLLFALCPFSIVEGAGNLHFEATQVAFLLWSLFFFEQMRFHRSAVFLSFAAMCKLLPLMLLPILIFRIPHWRGRIIFGFITTALLALSFLPFFNLQMLQNIATSLHLYVGVFEFNASIYYILRAFGFWLYDMNMIAFFGKILSIFVLFSLLFIAIFRQKWGLFVQSFLAFVIYFACATTIHPWYISNVLILAIFSPYRYIGLAWAALVFASYHAYNGGEQPIFVFIQYILLLISAFLTWRFVQKGSYT